MHALFSGSLVALGLHPFVRFLTILVWHGAWISAMKLLLVAAALLAGCLMAMDVDSEWASSHGGIYQRLVADSVRSVK